MKITKTQLRKIIKEEIQKEANEGGEGVHDIFNMPPDEPVEPSGNPKEDALRQIVATSTAGKVEGTMIDLFSAGAIVRMLDGLSLDSKAMVLDWPIRKMHAFAFGD
jgi:hypothetical protein